MLLYFVIEKQMNQVVQLSVLMGSVMSDSVTLWTVAYQAPLSMGFSKQEHWSGLHFLLQRIFLWLRNQTYASCIGRYILYH